MAYNKDLWMAVIGVLLLVALVAPASSQTTVATATVRVAAAVTLDQGLEVAIAERNGYFREEALIVKLTIFATGVEIAEALAAGAVDMGEASTASFTSLRAANVPVRILSTVSDNTNANWLILGKEFPIDKPEDLYGRKVSVAPGSGPHILLLKIFEKYKLDPTKIQIVFLGGPQSVAAFAAKQTDGFLAASERLYKGSDLRPTNWVVSGDYSNFTSNRGPINPPIHSSYQALGARDDFIRNNPEVVTRFMRALKKANIWMRDPANLEELKRLLRERLKLTDNIIAKVLDPKSPTRQVWVLDLTPRLLASLKAEGKFLLQRRSIRSEPVYSDMIYAKPLKDVAPEWVSYEGTWRP